MDMETHEYDHNTIAQWLFPLLVKKELTVERFAHRVGVTKATIWNYVHDVHRPRPEVMEEMCRVLGRPVKEGMAQYSPREIERQGRPRALRAR